MRRRSSVVSFVALAALVSSAGCGYRQPSTADDVRATAQTFVATCARHRPERATDLLSEATRAAFIRSGAAARACARFLGVDAGGRGAAESARLLRAVEVGSIRLAGDGATVELTVPGGAPSRLELERSGGEWQVEGPAGRI